MAPYDPPVPIVASVGVAPVTLARWQFGITTVFHFLFVPLTIGLAFLVAVMQTAAYRTGSAEWDRMARFFGRLFLVNFALGVVTGIVQEFQFGMDWSRYSTFVGNVFGPPLAIEGLLAFFLESTFLGVWIFGRGRVSARIHLASIWLVSVGTVLSAAFILAANAWMQHPVGYRVDPRTHQAVMTSFWAVLSNSTFVEEFLHVVLGALATGAFFMLGVSAWHLRRPRDGQGGFPQGFARSARLALVVGFLAILGTIWMGDSQARLMDQQQPMKMAAAEALYHTEAGASFSLLTIGNLSGQPIFQIRLPHMLSVLADGTWNGTVQGIDNVQAAEARRYGPGSYVPVIWVTYWSFRLMVGLGFLMLGIAAYGLWLMRRRRLERSRPFLLVATWSLLLPFLANTFGWIFTEMGRQPWVVYGLLKTSTAVSRIGTGYVATSLAAFTLVYGALAAVELALMTRLARQAPGEEPEEAEAEAVPSLVY
jgi:cytochrome d ubiquinol oxidase subunit I